MPCIAAYGVKKLINRMPIKCIECLNTVSHGWNIANNDKLFVEHNISHIELRDDGGLIWPSKIIIIVRGIIKTIFERFLQSETLLNDYHHCSSSCVALITLKQMLLDMIKDSTMFNHAARHYNLHNANRFHAITMLLTFFNILTNNFTILLNRREMTKKTTLKIVKDQKTKNRCINEKKSNNIDMDVTTWT